MIQVIPFADTATYGNSIERARTTSTRKLKAFFHLPFAPTQETENCFFLINSVFTLWETNKETKREQYLFSTVLSSVIEHVASYLVHSILIVELTFG